MAFATSTAGWLIPTSLLFIAIFLSISNGREKRDTGYDYPQLENELVSKGDLIDPEKTKEARKSIYDLPDCYPHSGGSVSMEVVDSIGPMTAKRPIVLDG